MKPSKARSRTDGGNRGQAGRHDPQRAMQAQRLQARLHRTETTASELARLVYDEACE